MPQIFLRDLELLKMAGNSKIVIHAAKSIPLLTRKPSPQSVKSDQSCSREYLSNFSAEILFREMPDEPTF
jgi:hypothetical protein